MNPDNTSYWFPSGGSKANGRSPPLRGGSGSEEDGTQDERSSRTGSLLKNRWGMECSSAMKEIARRAFGGTREELNPTRSAKGGGRRRPGIVRKAGGRIVSPEDQLRLSKHRVKETPRRKRGGAMWGNCSKREDWKKKKPFGGDQMRATTNFAEER